MAGGVQEPGDELGVVRRAAHQLAGADAVVEAGVELERAREERVADGRVGVGAVPDRVEVPHPSRGCLEEAEADEGGAPEEQLAAVVGEDPLVDRTRDDERCRDGRGLPDEAAGDRTEHAPAFADDDAPDEAPPRLFWRWAGGVHGYPCTFALQGLLRVVAALTLLLVHRHTLADMSTRPPIERASRDRR